MSPSSTSTSSSTKAYSRSNTAARPQARSQGARRGGRTSSRPKLLVATAEVLRECGYEPRNDASGVTLVNCPFHALAQDYTQLVCGMNLELMTGLVDGVQTSGLEARLEPAPGQCCVRLNKTAAVASSQDR
jgi:predicted ArsR family transcriptional regulator